MSSMSLIENEFIFKRCVTTGAQVAEEHFITPRETASNDESTICVRFSDATHVTGGDRPEMLKRFDIEHMSHKKSLNELFSGMI